MKIEISEEEVEALGELELGHHYEKGEEWGVECGRCGRAWPCPPARVYALTARLMEAAR